MIFVTVGSQKFQFDRLLEAIDNLGIKEEIFAQIGYSNYVPKNYSYKAFLNKDEFQEAIQKADIVITHGGSGSMVGALKKDKKVIAVPRLTKYGEHVTDHQIQLIEAFAQSDYLYPCFDLDLKKALEVVKNTDYKKFVSNTERIISDIESYIEKL